MSSASSSEILSFLRIAQMFSSYLKDIATNFWIFLQPKATLLKEGPFDSCVLTLPRLIYGDACDETILGRHIELFWEGRGSKEKILDYVGRILPIGPGCLADRKNNGSTYLCVNFSSGATTESITRATRTQVVPPWLAHSVEIFKMHRGLLHDKQLLEIAVKKCIELPAFSRIRVVPTPSIIGGGNSAGAVVNSGGNTVLPNVDCSAHPSTDEPALISPDSSSTQRDVSPLQDAFVTSTGVVRSPQDLHEENQSIIRQYNKFQYKIKDIPPSNVEKKAAAHILKRCEAERKQTGRVQLPSLKGQQTGRISYAKLPGKREGKEGTKKKAVTEVCQLLDVIGEFSGVEQSDIIMKQSKKLGNGKIVLVLDKLNPEERRSLGLLIMRVGRLTNACYHEMRMLLIWRLGKEAVHILGPPLEHLRIFRRMLASPDDVLHGEAMMKSTGGVYKKCHYWIRIHPQEALASDFARIRNSGRYQSSTQFSDGTDGMIFLATNTDGDTDTMSEMARICNQISGNSGDRVMMLGQIKDNANECTKNLVEFLLKEPAGLAQKLGVPKGSVKKSPLHTFRQGTFNDGVVVGELGITLPEGTTKHLEAAFYHECQDGQHVKIRDRRPDNFPTDLRREVVTDEKYLRPSPEAMKVDYFDQLRLLEYTDGANDVLRVPVAIGLVDDNNEIVSWSRLMDGEGNMLLENEGCVVDAISFRRVIGFSSDDTKILSLFVGHGGCSSRYHSPKCLHRHYNKMENIASPCVPRRGEYSHSNSYRIYEALGDGHDKDDRLERSYSICHTVIYILDPYKMYSGLFHQINGCVEKKDTMQKNFLESQDEYLVDIAEDMLQEANRVLEEAKKRQTKVTIEITALRKEIGNTPKQIEFNELKLASEIKKSGSHNKKKIADLQRIVDDAKAKLAPLKEKLDSRQKELLFIKMKYVPALIHSIEALKSYMPAAGNKRVSYLVLIQDEAYRKACGVRLRGYFGGRSMLGRDAYALIQGWPLVLNCFEEIFIERAEGGGMHNNDAIFKGLEGGAEVARPLSIMAEILAFQGKTAHLQELHMEASEDFAKALGSNFPDESPWYKGHGSSCHDHEIMDYYGFAGRGDEQGFENTHYVNGSLAEQYRSVWNSEQQSEILLQTREALRDQGAEIMLKEWMESRTKSARKVDDTERKAKFEERQQLWTKWAGQPRSILPVDPTHLVETSMSTESISGSVDEGELPPDNNGAASLGDDESGASALGGFNDLISDSSSSGQLLDEDEDGDAYSESSDDDIDDNDEDEESFSSDGEESEAFDVETERSMLLCQACYDAQPPSSCLLNLKAIVCCSICLQLVAKAALLFHVMKFHAMAPYLDEANDHFTEFLPGRGLDADGNEIEEGDDEEELDGSDEDHEEDDAEDELDGSDEDQEEDSDAEDYIGWNVTQLKDELKRRGVHTATEVNNMRKAALIEALEALDGQCQQ